MPYHKRDRKRYEVQRVLAILIMGSKCEYCQERRPWMLEFHHLKRVSWKAHKTSRHMRIKLYLRDWGDGICVLACGGCNKKKGQPPADKDHPDETIPF